MKNTLTALVIMAIFALAGSANAQNSASATATANATVVCPITITDNTNLEFGTITNSASGGYLIVAPDNSTTYSGVANFSGTPAGATPHSADFTVGGEIGFNYSITPSITANFGGSGATLSALTSSLGATSTFVGPTPNSTGCTTNDLKIGGRIDLTAAASGAYTATINVAVAYN